jgi:hypothetical protein
MKSNLVLAGLLVLLGIGCTPKSPETSVESHNSNINKPAEVVIVLKAGQLYVNTQTSLVECTNCEGSEKVDFTVLKRHVKRFQRDDTRNACNRSGDGFAYLQTLQTDGRMVFEGFLSRNPFVPFGICNREPDNVYRWKEGCEALTAVCELN